VKDLQMLREDLLPLSEVTLKFGIEISVKLAIRLENGAPENDSCVKRSPFAAVMIFFISDISGVIYNIRPTMIVSRDLFI